MTEREVRKICTSVTSAVTQWKAFKKEGKVVLDKINQTLFNDKEESSEAVKDTFDEDLVESCNTLQDILDKMSKVVDDLRSCSDKAQSVEHLLNISLDQSITSNKSRSMLSSSSSTSMCDTSQNTSHLVELAGGSVLVTSSDLCSWTNTLLSCYSTQMEMDRTVARTLCHLASRQEALFLTSVWLLQPGLDQDSQVAECAVSQLVRETVTAS